MEATDSQTEERRKRSNNGGGSTAGLRRRPADADGSDRKPRTTNDSRCSWFPIRFVRVRRFATPSNRSSPFVLCFLRCSVCESVRSVFSVFSTACYSKPQSALAERWSAIACRTCGPDEKQDHCQYEAGDAGSG